MTPGCDRAVETLLDLAEGLGPDGDIEAARAHVERCGRCRQRLADSMLVVVHLRRLADEAGRAEPPADAWQQLERRIRATGGGDGSDRRRGRGRGARRARSHDLAGLVAAALVIGLAGPLAAGRLAASPSIVSHAGSSVIVTPEPPPEANGRIPAALVRTDGGLPVAPDLLSALLPHGSVPDAIAPGADGRALDVPADGADVAATAASCPSTGASVPGCLPPIVPTPVRTAASSTVRHQVPDRR